jgi:pimeloyl-ACP methyl ester carboxylesterase
MATTWHERYVDNHGIRIAVRDFGGNAAPVVLIHGGPGQNLATWDDLAPRLAPNLRPIALDMRGNGASDDAEDYSYPALASDVQTVVRQLELESPMVIGHSWGGVLATYYASQYNDCVGVIAVDGWITDVHAGPGDDAVWEFIEADYSSDPLLNFVGTARELEIVLSQIAEEYGHAAAAVAHRQFIGGHNGLLRWRRSVKELIEVERSVGRHEHTLTTALYERISCPVRLVGAERSEAERRAADPEGRFGPWGFSRDATAPIVARYRNVSAEWWPSGHDIPHEMPGELARTILEAAVDWRRN